MARLQLVAYAAKLRGPAWADVETDDEASPRCYASDASTVRSRSASPGVTIAPCDRAIVEASKTEPVPALPGLLLVSSDLASVVPPPPNLPMCMPSSGSMGHPLSCGPACKYVWKSRGCKDGSQCSHCHLCKFDGKKNDKIRRQRRREVVKSES